MRIHTVGPMTKRLSERRTALITAGGIVAVIVAGAFAVGANIGILDASSDHQIGELAAAGDLVPTTQGALAPVTTGPATSATTAPQTYLVDVAGTVTVDSTGGTVVASAVDANPGWTSTPGPSDATHIEVTFSDGVRSLVFTATRATDGSIDVNVDDARPGTASAPTATTAPSSDDGSDDPDDGARGARGARRTR